MTTWAIEGQSSPSTTIDGKGNVTAGVDESSETITVIATGAGQTVTKELKVEKTLMITADKDEVQRGDSVTFDTNIPNATFELIMGSYSDLTYITEQNQLFIDKNETSVIYIEVSTGNQEGYIFIDEKYKINYLNQNLKTNLSGDIKTLIGN